MSTSVTSSNYSSVSTSNSSNNGLSGLMSGIDTDSMVKKMLSATQAKIDKQNQLKTTTEWKQEIYQGVVSDINTFKSKYFDSTYGSTLKTNLASSSFFNSMISSVKSGSSVKVVSSSSDASLEDMNVTVSQLAKAAKVVSSSKMSGTQTITGGAMDVASIKNIIDSGKELALTLSLDGTAKTMTFSSADFTGVVDATSIKSALDIELTKAFGSYVKAGMTDNKLTFSLNLKDTNGNIEVGHELTITGSDASSFGISPGASTLISGITKLGDLAGIQGSAYSFTINGDKFEFSSDDTVSGMISKINSSNAGVNLTYSSMTDAFSMEATSTGAQYSIGMTQETGNLLSLLFGSDSVSAGSKASNSVRLHTATVNGTGLDSTYTTTGASMKMNVNGKEYTFTLSSSKTDYTKANIESKLNTWLTETFGQTSGTSNISYADGKLTTAAGFAVSFEKTKVDTNDTYAVATAARTDLALAFGFSTNGATNAVTGDTNIADVLQFQGISFLKADGTTAATKLSEIALYKKDETTSYSVGYSNGGLCISGTAPIDLTGTALTTLFGSSVVLGNGTMASGAVTAGCDALLKINDVSTSRSSNTFTVDGITLTATNVSAEKTVIGTVRDTDSILTVIKSFVNDYNTMIDKQYKLITEDPDCRDYAPLTSAQRADMSESEIKIWEAKAKTGIVRSDADISSFLSDVRTAMYTTCEKAGMALYSIGVETSTGELAGKLTINESMLKNAIVSNPESVTTLFTDSTDGLAKQISTICDSAAKLSVASPGKLVKLAGAKGWSSNAKTNELYQKLYSISDKLDELKDKYDDEKQRYWAKFSAMETAMAKYSSQSSQITSMFS